MESEVGGKQKAKPASGGNDKPARRLTFKERLFLKHYVETHGNATEAVSRSYDVKSRRNANELAGQVMARPVVRAALDELLAENELTEPKLYALHRRFLALIDSDDSQDRKTALRALDMAYRLKGAYAPTRRENVTIPIPARDIQRLIDVFRERAFIQAKPVGGGDDDTLSGPSVLPAIPADTGDSG